MSIEKIMVVDDDSLSREFIAETLAGNDYEVITASDGNDALEKLNSPKMTECDVVFTDMKMPGMDGLQLLKAIKDRWSETIIVIMTAYGTVESAVEAMKMGAYDYIMKPVSPDHIELLLARIQERQNLINENRYLKSELKNMGDDHFDEIIGDAPAMHAIYEKVKKVSPSKASVLIQGESGTGKELIARAIHNHSPRCDKPFIKVNCAALSEGVLESELFGHERGAFTGAIAKREGRFELANKGTLLLDEVSEIPPSVQAKLLRVLEQEEFERVGGTRTIKTDVRIIATTNRDLYEEIEKGSFREDLFYRLNVVPIILPPLRERRSDIPILAKYFLDKFKRETNCGINNISDEAMSFLCAYHWPGNVRELKNLIHRLAVMDPGESLLPEHFSKELSGNGRNKKKCSIGASLEEVEREYILETLQYTKGNKTKAAEILGVTARTLRNKLNAYEARLTASEPPMRALQSA